MVGLLGRFSWEMLVADSDQRNGSQTAARPEPSRIRRFRWSLRLLTLAVTLTCLAFGWIGYLRYVGLQHQLAGEKLLKMDDRYGRTKGQFFDVFMNWEMQAREPSAPPTRRIVRRSPEWMESAGIDLVFQRITIIQIHSSNDCAKLDEALGYLRKLGDPPIVCLSVTGLSAEQIETFFPKFDVVTSLSVPHASLTEGPLPFLNHRELTSLDVSHTRFSNPAIEDLPLSLEGFDGTRTRITDAGLASFVRLKNLKWLYLHRTPTTKAAIEQLRTKMPWCEIHWEPLLPKHVSPKVKAPSP